MAASNDDGGGQWWVIGQRWAVGMHASSKVWPGTQASNALEPRACRHWQRMSGTTGRPLSFVDVSVSVSASPS